MKNPKVIAGLVVGLLFVIFLFQNLDYVPLQFYFWQGSVPKIILIPLAILVGFVAGFVVAKIKGRTRKSATGKDPKASSFSSSEPSTPEKEPGSSRRT